MAGERAAQALAKLRTEVERTSVRDVAQRMGVTITDLKHVLKGREVWPPKVLVARVRTLLGEPASTEVDWLAALRAEAEQSSQRDVAGRLGVSQTQVSQVLNGTYKYSTEQLQVRVRALLLNATVRCPVLGEIKKSRCEEQQGLPWRASSPEALKLYVTCPTCPNRSPD